MPYSVKSKKSGIDYFLHSHETCSQSGRRFMFFFAKVVKTGKGTIALDALPDGYTVTESEQTGLPLLKRAV